jgi:hypothetical protein
VRLCDSNGQGGQTQAPIQPIFAVFRHFTSRESDPQIHTHLLLLNTAFEKMVEVEPLMLEHSFVALYYRTNYRDTLRYQLAERLHLNTIDRELKKARALRLRVYQNHSAGVLQAAAADRKGSLSGRYFKAGAMEGDCDAKAEDHASASLLEAWQQIGREAGFNAQAFMQRSREQYQYRQEAKVLGAIAQAETQRRTDKISRSSIRLSSERRRCQNSGNVASIANALSLCHGQVSSLYLPKIHSGKGLLPQN